MIHDFIIKFNTIKMSAQLRLDALELLRPSVIVIEDFLRSRLIKTGFPKHQRCLGVIDKIVVAKKNRKLYFGVQLLASQIIAVTYLVFDAAENDVPKKGYDFI